MEVRTRIAPSPTGYPHIATIYQVMFDFVFAKKYNGKFILRIEDTDRARFVEGAEQVIFDSLKWFGLEPDEGPVWGGEYGPYRQSERLDIYQKYAKQLKIDLIWAKKAQTKGKIERLLVNLTNNGRSGGFGTTTALLKNTWARKLPVKFTNRHRGSQIFL